MAAEEQQAGGQKRGLELEDEVLSLEDVLEEHDAMEEEACAVLGGSDPELCSYPQGYIKRQALYACSTCTPKGEEAAGICLACSYKCHEGHDLFELYTKRNFRCDCGNSKFKNMQCKLYSDKDNVNILNKYDDNFFGLYCTCKRPYPDPEDETPDEMIQCVVCEDWFHERHLGAIPEENIDFQEMICPACMNHCHFLWAYAATLSVPTVTKITPLDTSSEELHVEVADDCKTRSMEIQNGAGSANASSEENSDTKAEEVLAKGEIGHCNGPSTSKTVANGDAASMLNLVDGANTCRLKLLNANTVLKGDTATFWPSRWRSKLCACKHCLAMYYELDLPFLLEECDTVDAYETKGKSDNANRQDPLMSALNSMDRFQQVELIYEYNDMKTELKEYLKRFADEGKVVKTEDIQQFFEELRSRKKRRVDGMQYYCR
ncbi:putative E3 ubiquitin-protein ligase UBR7 [Ambystoma mexicanum]|uniref:putative E3 ubiquitin-protein ligase UBR7 n=1 Tax=Ambystoma mexicanum TaxID=8296 RepID=UPI0037E78809